MKLLPVAIHFLFGAHLYVTRTLLYSINVNIRPVGGGEGEGYFHHVHGGDMYALRLDFTIPAIIDPIIFNI